MLRTIQRSVPLSTAEADSARAVLSAVPAESGVLADLRAPHLARLDDGRFTLRGRNTNRERFAIEVHPDRLDAVQTVHPGVRVTFAVWLVVMSAAAVVVAVQGVRNRVPFLLLVLALPAVGLLTLRVVRHRDWRTLLRLLGVSG